MTAMMLMMHRNERDDIGGVSTSSGLAVSAMASNFHNILPKAIFEALDAEQHSGCSAEFRPSLLAALFRA